MSDDVRGLTPQGPPSWSPAHLVLPLQVADSEEKTTAMFAYTSWLLPRVPAIGEEVVVLGHRINVERVTWGSDGIGTVRLRELRVFPSALETLESEGWKTASWDIAPPLQEWADS